MPTSTGRFRYRAARVRRGLFGFREVLVLQIEETVEHAYPLGPSIEIEHHNVWRDAQVSDMPVRIAAPTLDVVA